jgi:hypothetical protein
MDSEEVAINSWRPRGAVTQRDSYIIDRIAQQILVTRLDNPFIKAHRFKVCPKLCQLCSLSTIALRNRNLMAIYQFRMVDAEVVCWMSDSNAS